MKVLMACEDFLEFGGGPRVVQRLSEKLIERGHEVTVTTPDWENPTRMEEAENAGIDVATFPAKFGIFFIRSRIPLDFVGLGEYDVVHSHSYMFIGYVARLAKNFFCHTHGLRTSVSQEHGIPGWVFHKLVTERVLNSANSKGAIFAVSNRDLEQCKTLGFENSIFCPNGIDFEEISRANGDRFRRKYGIDGLMILEVSRLWRLKGQLRFLRQCLDMVKKGTDTDVATVFIGATADKDYVNELQREASGRDDVLVISDAPDEEVWRAYNAADVLILPSEFEGSPLVVHEAAAARTPSVATNVGDFLGADEIGYCRLVPSWNPKKFTDEVIKLLEDDELRKELGKRGFDKAKEMSWESMAMKVEEKYHEALEKSPE